VNRAEALRQIAELHTAWSLEHGDEVPYNPADENPHEGHTTDLSIWQADRSAPPAIDDPLNEAIKKVLAQIDDDGEPSREQMQAQARSVLHQLQLRHMSGKHDQSSHAHGGSAGIRQSLQDASTTGEVSAVLASEASALTGRTVHADLTGAQVDVAREYAEGLLRGYERFPNCQVDQVFTYGRSLGTLGGVDGARPDTWPDSGGAFAAAGIAATPSGVAFVHSIGFNMRYSGDYGTAVLADNERSGWTVRGGHMGTALHEYGHHVGRTTSMTVGATRARAIADGQAKRKGVTTSAHIRQQISKYASKNQEELVAEAFADMMLRGADAASELSQAIFGEMSSRYESRP